MPAPVLNKAISQGNEETLPNFVTRVHTRKHNSLCHNLERRKTDTCLLQQSSRDANFFFAEFRFPTTVLPVIEQSNFERHKD